MGVAVTLEVQSNSTATGQLTNQSTGTITYALTRTGETVHSVLNYGVCR